jgi:peroxiredoxin-like protein
MTTHISSVKVEWVGGFKGHGRVRSPGFTTPISLPKELGGLHEGASPEDLFLSSVVGCYVATLGIILEKAGVTYQALSVHGELITRTSLPVAIQEVKLVVDITTDTPREAVEELAERVDGFCVIAGVLRPDLKKSVRINHKTRPSSALSAEVSHA